MSTRKIVSNINKTPSERRKVKKDVFNKAIVGTNINILKNVLFCFVAIPLIKIRKRKNKKLTIATPATPIAVIPSIAQKIALAFMPPSDTTFPIAWP
jgi:hypothetical protein